MKKALSLILVLVMLIGMVPMQVFATNGEINEENLWQGKSAVFVGDSITAGSGTTKIYYQYLEEAFGFGFVTAMGVAGSCVSTALDYGHSNQPLIDRYQTIPSADLIVVFMGTNDYGHETPLGSIEDTQDGTFYGALNVIIPTLVTKHPSSKIVFITPMHRYGFGTSKILGTQFTYDDVANGVGATLGDYVDALKTVCGNYDVSVIDLYTECTLDPADAEIRTNYMPDGLHPNAAGHELIAGIMESHIRNMEPAEKVPEIETDPVEETALIYGNKFVSGFTQQNRASARANQYLKAGTVITLKNPETFQWACVKTNGEYSNNNLGYFPDSAWSDKETAVVTEDGWVGFVFKHQDENQVFDLTKPLTDYITIEEPHAHSYFETVTAPTCTEQGYTTYTCDCGDSYVDDYTDVVGHCYENIVCVVCGDSFSGKSVSILSHSMSTYAGVSNSTAANSTLGNNDVYYTAGRHDVYLKDTWWQQTIDALGMELLVNNSWSGSCVFMPRKGDASVGYGDRAVNLHNDHTGEEPDIIFVYLGCNDFAYYKDSFGKAADVNYNAIIQDNGDGTFTYATPDTTCEAYAIMLHKAANRYPDAEIYCITSTARREMDYTGDSYPDAGQPTEYSAQLQQIARYYGYPVVDLENAITKEVEIFDKYMGDKRAHANTLGMDQITNEVLSVLLGKDAQIGHVTSADGTVREQAVLLGGNYSAVVDLQDGYSVVVTMNGIDITQDAFSNGIISIDNVTGDIDVHAVIHRDPQSFRWEIQDDALVSVGDTDNAVEKLAGTISNGMLSNTRYELTTSVVLKHNLPWEVEWQFAGNWRGCVFTSDPVQSTKDMIYLSRTVGGQLCFGTWTGKQYDNYGVDLSGLDDQAHTYRLENRIAADGTNMVWLYVDGEEIGPMNRYFIGSKDQNQTSDWINGKDFVFSYISMDGHALKECKLNYLQVQEYVHNHAYESTVTAPTCTEQGYTTYTCDCGDSYADDYVESDGHDFTDWYVTREATYEQTGEECRDCKKCSHVEFRSVELAVVTSGNVGYGKPYTDAVTYTLYADGTMVIAGSGTVYCSDWRGNNQPYYAYRDQVKTLIIEEGITQTSGGCFAYFVNLESVSISDSLTKINKNAFMNSFVSSMTSITVPTTVTYLADYAFGFYSGAASAIFTDVIIENPNVGFHASNAVFNSGKQLQNLTLYSYGAENNVRTYAETHGCRYIDLNNYLEGDFGDIHYELSNGILVLEALVENAEIPSENQPWVSMVDKITKIVISEGVATISDNAFADYTVLTEVKLPNTLKTIGDGVFAVSQNNNTSLTMALPRRLTAVGENLFAGRSNVNLTVYYGSAGADIAEFGVTLDIQKVFKILLIGNSFSEDASNAGMPNSQMLDILQAMLGEDAKITVGLCYSGGKGLNWHATQSEQGNSSYSLRVISTESGSWKNYGSYTSAKALTWTDWDVVSLQHYEINTTTGKESNAYSDQVDPKFDNLKSATEFMLDYVDAYAPDATVYFYMHWARAYKPNLNESLATYNKMADFFPVVMDYAGPESNQKFEGIIPVGLAVQNARTTYLATLAYNTTAYADKTLNLNTDAQIGLQRDTGHLSYNIGRYLAALTFAETIIPEQMRTAGYVLPEIRITESVGKLPTEYSIIAQKSAFAAVNSWRNGSLAVTNIDGYTEDPTVAASETLKSILFHVNKNDALATQIESAVLDALPADFAVSKIEIDENAMTAEVTICFGYTSKTVTVSYATSAPIIIQQPESVEQEIGKKFAVTVKAEGEGLSYQWYYKDAGMKNFGVSSNKTSSYTYTMQSYMHNRQVYCVITDQYENTVTTDVATITRPPVELKILTQPKDVQTPIGEKFSIKPEVQGDGLTYQWYYKESYQNAFSVSSNKTSAYAYTMQTYMHNRQVYCVITDQYGNSVTTEVATITRPPMELALTAQPQDVCVEIGEKFSVKPTVQGDGLTYQWYYKESYQKTFSVSSNKTSAYAYAMQSYMNGRQVYCVITDQYGNQITTEIVTIHVTK